jgi:hypothetical protein
MPRYVESIAEPATEVVVVPRETAAIAASTPEKVGTDRTECATSTSKCPN